MASIERIRGNTFAMGRHSNHIIVIIRHINSITINVIGLHCAVIVIGDCLCTAVNGSTQQVGALWQGVCGRGDVHDVRDDGVQDSSEGR